MKILILYASAGYGHRKAAEAVSEALINAGCKKDNVRVLDALDLTNPFYKWSYVKTYYYMAKFFPYLWWYCYGLLDLKWVCIALSPIRHIFNWFQSFKLRKFVTREQPDVICSTHFFSPEVLGHLKIKGKIKSKMVTVVTDFSLHAYWVNRGTDTYCVMADSTKEQIASWGVPEDIIHVTGIPIMSKFARSQDKESLLKKYELNEGTFTILVTSGSFGIGPITEILRELEGFSNKVQCVVVCGKNKKLFDELKPMKFSINVKVFGFVDTMEELMSMADVAIAKPGGITTSESLAKSLVMIISCPIPGQEERNANFLIWRNAAYEIKRPSEITPLIRDIIDNPGKLEELKAKIKEIAKPNSARDVARLILSNP